MPRYDYRCTSCNHEFELVQSFSEAGVGTCPLCRNSGQRVYHAVPVIYKGSGFYTTDYGRPKPPADDGKTESSSTDSKAKPDSKTKPDSKAESSNGSSTSSDSKSESTSKADSEAPAST